MNVKLSQSYLKTKSTDESLLCSRIPELSSIHPIQKNKFADRDAAKNCSTRLNLANRLDEIAAQHPDFAALIQGSKHTRKTVSYQHLSEMVKRRACILRSGGLRKGDRVLMLQPISIDLFVSILAVFRIGATVLIVDVGAGRDKVNHAIDRAKPRAVIAAGKGIFATIALKSARLIKLKFSNGPILPGWNPIGQQNVFRSKRLRAGAPVSAVVNNTLEELEPVTAEHPALITLTSGTSGKAKLIVRSHEFLRTQLEAVSANCEFLEGSSELTSLPVFALANLATRVTTILPDANLANLKNTNIDRVIDQLKRFQPERILGSPAFIERIVEQCASQSITLPFVKTIITGGGPVFPRLQKTAKNVCENANIFTVYGSSEAEPVSKINSSELSNADMVAIANGAGLPVGFPIAQIKIRIEPLVEKENQMNNPDRLSILRHICELKNLKLNAIGEILVTGEHVVKGYDSGIGDEETKVRVGDEVWHRTGDVGYLDTSGRLWLTGRLNKRSSDDVQTNYLDTSFALSVEAAVLFDESIEKAACLTLNEITTLYIESTETLHPIDTWTIKNRLSWSQLSEIKLVRKIPVDTRHSSKVLYHKLAESA
jgi:olefin beta-lactone synthetase